MDGVVHGSGNQVLEHLAVLAHDGGLDLHALHLVPAAHHDLDHSAAGLAGDFNVGDLGLGLLHVGLHGLGLLHQIVEIASHRGRTPEGAARRCAQLVRHYFTGRTVSGSSVAPKRSRRPCTPASASNARRAESNSCCVARCSTCAGVSTPGAAVSNSSRTLSPKWRDSACASFSSCAGVRTSLLRGSSARRTTVPCRPMNTQLLASWRARPDSSSWLTSDAQPATASAPGIAVPASGASPRCSPEVATGTTPDVEAAAAPTAGLTRPPLAPGARVWLASPPGRNAIILSRVISNPVRGSGASARSRLPMIAV